MVLIEVATTPWGQVLDPNDPRPELWAREFLDRDDYGPRDIIELVDIAAGWWRHSEAATEAVLQMTKLVGPSWAESVVWCLLDGCQAALDPNEYVPLIANALAIVAREGDWSPKRKSIPPKVETMIFRRDGYACRECGEDNVRKLTIDHRIPLDAGGTDEPENLRTLCRSCNSAKGNRLS